jgi:hypothetical protein
LAKAIGNARWGLALRAWRRNARHFSAFRSARTAKRQTLYVVFIASAFRPLLRGVALSTMPDALTGADRQ